MFLDKNAIRYLDPDHSEDEDRFLMLGMSFTLRALVMIWPKDGPNVPVLRLGLPEHVESLERGFFPGNQKDIIERIAGLE